MVDVSEDAGVGEGVVFRHGGVEFVRRRDLLLGLGDEVDELLAPLRPRRGLVVRLRRDPTKGRLPGADRVRLQPNQLHDGVDRLLIRRTAEENNVFARLAGVLTGISLILELGGRMGNVSARQKKDAFVGWVGAETDEDTTGAFVVRCIVGSDGETGSKGEWLAQLRDALQLGVRVEPHELHLAATIDGLDEGDLSIREAGILEYR